MMKKKCSKCSFVKSISEFYKQKSSIDGHGYYCKKCIKSYRSKYYKKFREKLLKYSIEYAKTEKGKQIRRKYMQCDKAKKRISKYEKSEKVKARRKKYRQSERGKEVMRKGMRKYYWLNKEKCNIRTKQWSQTEKGIAARKRGDKKRWRRNPLERKARVAVWYAVKAGILAEVHTVKCIKGCGNQAQQYHHHKGYDEKHWMDVIPVCRECHNIIHRSHNEPPSSTNTLPSNS